MSATKVKLTQRTEEWRVWRNSMLGASDIAVLFGCSPFKKYSQLWKEKAFGEVEVKENFAMRRGNALETPALMLFNSKIKKNLSPACFEIPELKLCASLDGYDEETRTAVEIKVPGKDTVQMALRGQVPRHYLLQMQAIMLVADLPEMYYAVFEASTQDLFYFKVERDEKIGAEIIEKAKIFWDSIAQMDAPPEEKKKEVREVVDDKGLSEKWLELLERKKALDEEEKALREQIILEVGGENGRLGKIVVSKTTVKGAIDTKKVEEDLGISLESFRKKPSERLTIREYKNKEED